jgi:hypothetical protein
MRLESDDGIVVELSPLRYQFGSSSTPRDWDANWLIIAAAVRLSDGRSWSFADPCLTTWEARELASWLRGVLAGEVSPAPFGGEEDERLLVFTEPNLAFSLASSDAERITLRLHLSLESRPPWLHGDTDSDLFDYFIEVSAPRKQRWLGLSTNGTAKSRLSRCDSRELRSVMPLVARSCRVEDASLGGLWDGLVVTPKNPQVSGWKPDFLSADEQFDRQTTRLRSIIGLRLTETWLVWNLEHDEWFADLPVVLRLNDGPQLEVCWEKMDDLSVTWDTIDVTVTPKAWVEWPLEWRREAHPALAPGP